MSELNAIWNDNRKDWYEITDEKIKKDAKSIAIIFTKNGIIDKGNGYSTLKTNNYGKLFDLCKNERFRDQPVAAVPYFTGFLVKENIIATVGHCVNERNVTYLRFIFGFKMLAPSTPVIEVPGKNIYNGIKLMKSKYQHNGADWALVKLDRNVTGQEAVTLSRCETSCNQPVHAIGHPCGLPLKYAPGGCVCENKNKDYFTSDLNMYSGNSGSPVFNSNTHEVMGIAARGYSQDFKLENNCWASIDRSGPNRQEEVHCTRVSEFINILDKC